MSSVLNSLAWVSLLGIVGWCFVPDSPPETNPRSEACFAARKEAIRRFSKSGDALSQISEESHFGSPLPDGSFRVRGHFSPGPFGTQSRGWWARVHRDGTTWRVSEMILEGNESKTLDLISLASD